MTQPFDEWVDLKEAGMELILVRVPAGRGYYIVRDLKEVGDGQGIAKFGKGLRELGFRKVAAGPNGKSLYLRSLGVGKSGRPLYPPNARLYGRHVAGAREIPFETGTHFIDQLAPPGSSPTLDLASFNLGAYGNLRQRVREDALAHPAFRAAIPEEPAIRSGLNASVEAVLGNLCTHLSTLVAVFVERPELLARPLPTAGPGSTPVDVLRATLANQVREDLEPEVREVLERPAPNEAGPVPTP